MSQIKDLIEELKSLTRYDMEVREYGRTKFRDSHAEAREVVSGDGDWVEWEDIVYLIKEYE